MVAPQNVRSVTLFKGRMGSELPAWNVKWPGGMIIELARIEPDNDDQVQDIYSPEI